MAKNEFLPFGTAEGANVLSNQEYEALAARHNGFNSGVAKSKELNKVWRQASLIASAVAQFIVDTDQKDLLDTGDVADIKSRLASAINLIISNGDYVTNPYLMLELLKKIDKADIAQQLGNDTGKVASQNLLTTELGKKASVADANGKLAKDQNGADIPDKPKFIENLGLPEKYFPLSGGTVSGEVKTEKRLIVENKNGFSGIELAGLTHTVVIETDTSGSGYFVIRDKTGKNVGSVTLSTLMDVNSFIYPGKIEWCSLPLSEIRPHCYHANGDKYPLTSDLGKALRSLSQAYKTAHGITESDGMINMPNAYHSDGRGYFFRANTLGLKQEDISRRIYGAIGIEKGIELPTSYGVFTQNFVDIDSASHTGVSRSSKGTWNFDSSNVTPTGNENRPISYGLIPIVYLGV